MGKKALIGLIIALVAAAAIVYYIVEAGKDKPFRPPTASEDLAADRAMAAILENDAELKALHSMVEMSPEDAEARASYGSALMMRGLFVRAKEQLLIAVSLDPENGDAHRNMGTVLSEMEDLDGAMQYWQEAIRINPDDPAAYNNLGNGYYRRSQAFEAIRVWRKSVELSPAFAPTRVNLGYAFIAVDSLDAAREQLDIAVSLEPALSSSYYALATMWGLEGEADSCIHYLSKGLELSPELFRQATNRPAFNIAKDDSRFADLRARSDQLTRMRGAGAEN